MKQCRKCGTEKHLQSFYKDKSAKDGHRNICRTCTITANNKHQKELCPDLKKSYRKVHLEKHGIENRRKQSRKSRIKRRYGLTVEEYEAHLESPCDICGDKAEHLDHCHATGKVRGGLCRACNWMLGNSRDSIDILNNAIIYLKENNDVI